MRTETSGTPESETLNQRVRGSKSSCTHQNNQEVRSKTHSLSKSVLVNCGPHADPGAPASCNENWSPGAPGSKAPAGGVGPSSRATSGRHHSGRNAAMGGLPHLHPAPEKIFRFARHAVSNYPSGTAASFCQSADCRLVIPRSRDVGDAVASCDRVAPLLVPASAAPLAFSISASNSPQRRSARIRISAARRGGRSGGTMRLCDTTSVSLWSLGCMDAGANT